jgi:hypothetical protein
MAKTRACMPCMFRVQRLGVLVSPSTTALLLLLSKHSKLYRQTAGSALMLSGVDVAADHPCIMITPAS